MFDMTAGLILSLQFIRVDYKMLCAVVSAFFPDIRKIGLMKANRSIGIF